MRALVCLSVLTVAACGSQTPMGIADSGAMDGGTVDSGVFDAGMADAGTDAGMVDAGTDAGMADAGTDAGPADAGADAGVNAEFDAGVIDAGVDAGLDAGAIDAGADAGLDAGAIDTGVDAGAIDAGAIDAGDADAGTPDLDGGTDDDGGPCVPYVVPDAGVAAAGIGDKCGVDLGDGVGAQQECQSDLDAGVVCALDLDKEELDGQQGTCAVSQYSVADGIVADNVTGLLWEQGPGPADGGYTWDPTGQDPSSAQYYCAHLNLGCLSWRLPDMVELFSIVEYTGSGTVELDPTAFPDTQAEFYWSSTPAATDGGSGWGFYTGGGYFGVGFTYALSADCEQGQQNCQVRCVH